MAEIRRSRTLAGTPEEIWAIVGDPHHLPRWWPRVTRVEGVGDGAFTQVLQTDGGRTVRADFRIVASTPLVLQRWAQALEGTPFGRVLDVSETEVSLRPDGARTRVTLSRVHRLRGTSRLGALMVRRAAARQLDEALDGLQALVG